MSDHNVFQPDSIAALAAAARLLVIAKADSGQARRVADFLLAWHNAEENGGLESGRSLAIRYGHRAGHSFGGRIHSRRTQVSRRPRLCPRDSRRLETVAWTPGCLAQLLGVTSRKGMPRNSDFLKRIAACKRFAYRVSIT